MGNPCVHKRVACLFRGCQEPGQPNAESAVLTCSPGFLTVENHWDTGSPLPNSSVCDVSGMIFAPLPFSGKETEGSGEFALLSFPLALYPLTNRLNTVSRVNRSWCDSKEGGNAARRNGKTHAVQRKRGVLCVKKPECLRLNR